MPDVTVTVRDSQGNVASQVVTVQVESAAPTFDRVLAGSYSTQQVVPTGEVWKIESLVEMDAVSLVVEDGAELHVLPGAHIRFLNVNEAAFTGSAMGENPDTDIGLWAMGRLVISGTPRAGWNRTGADPTWQPSDRLMSTPIQPGDYTAKPFTLGSPVPTITLNGMTFSAEVFNLSRDILIEGTPTGRAHLHVSGHGTAGASVLEYFALRYMGVPGKMGRYPLHIHHMHGGSDGVVVKSVVLEESGHNGVMVHLSDGVTVDDTVAYRTNGGTRVYGWDDGDRTKKHIWKHCLSVEMTSPDGFRNADFWLGNGTDRADILAGLGNKMVDCCAAGNTCKTNGAGAFWPEGAGGDGIWDVVGGFVAHNILRNGLHVWQNSFHGPHPITNYVAYNCDRAMEHGAYSNSGYLYSDILSVNCAMALESHSLPAAGPAPNTDPTPEQQALLDDWLAASGRTDGYLMSWERVVVRGGTHAIYGTLHNVAINFDHGGMPLLYRDWDISGLTDKVVLIDEQPTKSTAKPGFYDIVTPVQTINPTDVKLVAAVTGMRLRVQNRDGSCWQMDAGGVVTTISPFYPAS